jgi:hypothetical protein
MSTSKSVSKVSHVSNVTKESKMKKKPVTTDTIVNVTAAPSQEVSAPTRTLVTSAPALASAVAAAAPVTPPGDLPPAVGAPATPADWVPAPRKKRGARGLRPKAVQVTNAEAAAKEITASTTYVADFGSRAPAAPQVAFVVTNAVKWRDTWQAAKKFFAYASEQRATWENDALAQMDALKPAFTYAASRDGTIAEKYSATSKFLGATNAIASRAATSRKAKAKASKTPAEPVAVAAPQPPEPVAPAAK